MYRILILLLIIPAILRAQPLTLKDAVEKSLLSNTEINQARAILKQKENEWRTLIGIEAPEVSYFEEGVNNKAAKPFEERRWTISQSVDFPLTSHYRVKASKQAFESFQYQVVAMENEIKVMVKSRYIEVLYALYLQELGKQQQKLAEDLYNAVYTRFETGVGNGMDLANAELLVAQAKNDLSDAERLLHQARYSLFYLMGLEKSEISYQIQFSDSLQTNDIGIRQIETLAVLEEQPTYLAALYEQQAAINQVKEAKSNILPDISFSLYRQNYGDGFDYNGFEVGLSIPIWLPFEQKGRIRIAEARQGEIQWKQKSIELDMKRQIEHAWHNYQTSKQTIDRYHETIQEKSQILQSLSLEAYRLGELDLLNLLNAQQTYLKNQKSYLIALRDYYLQLAFLEKFLNKELIY
ncbi:TolC family protein [Sunxiuqinia sp. A32]|uniref:TolC family protein n=1 Tax=Sunxiuqinia sp. A32 TaxID=3461496 RepID=UPI00404558E7